MAPFTRWLPAQSDRTSDLIIEEAGDGHTDLAKSAIALVQAIADLGFHVMAQTARADAIGPTSSVRIRVSQEPIRSMGHGCDVVVYLGQKMPAGNPFHLQRGSVLIADERCICEAPPHAMPEGVITYPIPLARLIRQGGSDSQKGIFTTGILAQILGISAETVRRRLEPDFNRRRFVAGFTWAAKHLRKRDIYALPTPPGKAPWQVILNARQAMVLGLEVGNCGCKGACAERFKQSPEEWIAEHVNVSWKGAVLSGGGPLPIPNAYRSSGKGSVVALLDVVDPTKWGAVKSTKGPAVVVAADLLDALRLLVTARCQVRAGTPIWVVLDDVVSNWTQSIGVEAIEQVVRKVGLAVKGTQSSCPYPPELLQGSERDVDSGSEIGFVGWGASQGVVREAVVLCRSFGLKVAALYPKVLWPVPRDDLYSFAKTVKRLVVVEPSRDGQYTRLVGSSTSLRPSSIMPEPGQALTPMDIFLREDLGFKSCPNE